MGFLQQTDWQGRLAPLLQPLGQAYGQLMRCREAAYRAGWIDSWRPPVPCISVGNVNWGGSGKSPLCSKLLDWSLERGMLPVLLTRGYKARPPEHPYLVRPDSPVDESGDEPLMLARLHPGAAVVVDPRRSRSGRWAVDRQNPDLLILDDAFQHLAVDRDVDLVILTAEDVSRDWNRILPAGRWREGARALQRASALLLHASPEELGERRAEFLGRLDGLGKPIFSFSLVSRGLRRLVDGCLTAARPGRYLLVSAVGSPHRVAATAEESLGRPPGEHLVYPDHHFFSESDWQRIRREAEGLGCSRVVCTPKDAVKLERWADHRLYTFDLDLVFGPALKAATGFWTWLEGCLPSRD